MAAEITEYHKRQEVSGLAEILAPVGGSEQLSAAVRCGADAVYLGVQQFNARRNASNFDGDGMSLDEAVAYCHAAGVKVYVTLNTLITDSERAAMAETIERVAHSGADAVIVQDLSVAELARQICPSLALHASTQMTVTNLDGVLWLARHGFSRVVLARELSLAEITAITAASPIEIEIFIHGALCMSVSGRCYLSSVIGERSGNRGLCAQPCRLDFDCGGRPYALSLKDMSHLDYVRQLADCGVASFKIEGRMKRPEYVAAAVDACRRALQGEDYDADRLQKVFSRSGFTDGYLTGRRNVSMFGHRRREDVVAGAEVLSQITPLYRRERASVPLTGTLTAHLGQPTTLTVSDGEHTVTASGDVPEVAQHPLDEQALRDSLQKTGGTPYYFEKLDVCTDVDMFLPRAQLNALRRETLERLDTLRRTPPEREIFPLTDTVVSTAHAPAGCRLRLRLERAEQLTPSVERLPDVEFLILPVEQLLAHPDLLARWGDRLMAELPEVVFESDRRWLHDLLDGLHAQGVRHVSAGNLCTLAAASAHPARFVLHGGFGLNVLNTDALTALERNGLTDTTVSFELSAARIARLGGTLPRGIVAYGHLPLMVFRSCPARGESCGDCTGESVLTDRLGKRFPLRCQGRRISMLYNCVPLYVGDKRITGVDFATLYFTGETAAQVEQVVRLFADGGKPEFERTNGLYFRELNG